LRKIYLPANVYAALEEKAKMLGFSVNELASAIVLIRAKR